MENAVAMFMSLFSLAEELACMVAMLGFMAYLVRESVWQMVFPVLMLSIDAFILYLRSAKQVRSPLIASSTKLMMTV